MLLFTVWKTLEAPRFPGEWSGGVCRCWAGVWLGSRVVVWPRCGSTGGYSQPPAVQRKRFVGSLLWAGWLRCSDCLSSGLDFWTTGQSRHLDVFYKYKLKLRKRKGQGARMWLKSDIFKQKLWGALCTAQVPQSWGGWIRCLAETAEIFTPCFASRRNYLCMFFLFRAMGNYCSVSFAFMWFTVVIDRFFKLGLKKRYKLHTFFFFFHFLSV